MLRPLTLTLHHNTTGLMGQTHRRIRLINMLTTSTRSPVSISTHIRRINLNINIVINLRRHIDRRKRRMATIARIKRRLAHQAVHTNLRAQPAKSILARHLHSGTLNTSHITSRALHQLRLKTLIVSPAQIHTQQHLRPVLRLSAARARLNIQVGIVRIHLTAKHTAKLQLSQLRLKAGNLSLHLSHSVSVILLNRHLQQLTGIRHTRVQILNSLNHSFQRRALAAQLLSAIRVIPHIGFAEF